MASVNFSKMMFKISRKMIDKNFITKDFRRMSRLSNIVFKCNQPCILKKSYDEKDGKSQNNRNSYFLLGGSFTFFGLLKSDEDKKEEPEYITSMKRSILLTQV